MALLKNMNVFIRLILLHTSQNTMGGLRSKKLRQWSTSITLPIFQIFLILIFFDFGIFYWSVVRIHIYITIDYDGIWRSL